MVKKNSFFAKKLLITIFLGNFAVNTYYICNNLNTRTWKEDIY